MAAALNRVVRLYGGQNYLRDTGTTERLLAGRESRARANELYGVIIRDIKRHTLTRFRAAAFGVTLATTLTGEVTAQKPVLEEIVVTGSAIRRIDLDQALPVTVLNASAIRSTGVSNVNELIEKLPAMQNMTVPADSVGGGGGGIRTANLRGIGEEYTLSLLNGRRMSPATSGSTIDLSSIPLAAVERVEILRDGASALYGSDAIAGVVNFILKDSVEGITVSSRFDEPLAGGGRSFTVDVVGGLGDPATDGYSFVLAYSREDQGALAAADRTFSESGFVAFSEGGRDYYFENSSANAIPGNAFVYAESNGGRIRFFNPDRAQNGGVCAPQTTPSGESCRFDYTSTLEILPEHERDSIFVNGRVRIGDNLTGFATVLHTANEQISRIAPYPTGEVPLPLDSDVVRSEVLPHLTPDELAAAGAITGTWRALPGGNRTRAHDIETTNATFGLEGSRGDLDYQVGMTLASMSNPSDYLTGWLIRDTFVDLVGSGRINIFANHSEFMDGDALAPAIYSGNWSVTDTTMHAFNGTASMPLFELAGGEAMLAVGADWRETEYEHTISKANADAILLYGAPGTPYLMERAQYGIFVELLLSLADRLELTASLRHDEIDAVEDRLGGRTIGLHDHDLTYKLATMFDATDRVSFRASFGTGFKAPSMRQIGQPRTAGGYTSGDYLCPFEAHDPLAALCWPDEAQYPVFREGHEGLRFETSEQWNVGVVLTPWDDFDATIDYWSIELENFVSSLTEAQIFADPVKYRHLFTSMTNLSTGRDDLAIIKAFVNVGRKRTKGIDFAVNKGFVLGGVYLKLGVSGTWIGESVSSLTGSSLGRFGEDAEVVFERLVVAFATIEHGNFAHNLWINYRSGYDDQMQTVEILGTGAVLGRGPRTQIQLDIDEQYILDYQLRYTTLGDRLGLTVGINNLTDEAPPLSLRDEGAGHQVGWDPRYSDAYGQTVYLGAEYAL